MLRAAAALPGGARAAVAVMVWQQKFLLRLGSGFFSMCSVSYVLARSLFGDGRLVCWAL